LGTVFGLVHGCLGQAFFVLLGVIALLLSPLWERLKPGSGGPLRNGMRGLLAAGTGLIFLQLLLGATMRHQHAGLAIPDFPLAYGNVLPATDPESLLRYNQQREHESVVTGFQIWLQMFHRLGAVAAVGTVFAAFIRAWRSLGWLSVVTRGTAVWAGLLVLQFSLGMATIWTRKAADVATAHVAGGALALLGGTLLILLARKLSLPVRAAARPDSLPTLVRSATH
jgi:cytochrome c oxidase assembly protein subunit 15